MQRMTLGRAYTFLYAYMPKNLQSTICCGVNLALFTECTKGRSSSLTLQILSHVTGLEFVSRAAVKQLVDEVLLMVVLVVGLTDCN